MSLVEARPARDLAGVSVSDVLTSRARERAASSYATTALSIFAHGALISLLVVTSRSRPQGTFIPIALPVRVVSPSALQRPGSAPSAAAPSPAQKARPVIEKAAEVQKPSERALPAPGKTKKRLPEPPAPAMARTAGARSRTAGPAVELPSAGEPGGGTGTSSFGAAVSAFDADFPFAYYVEQLQSLIGANWLKPDVPSGTSCQVAFRVLRSGQVSDIRVEAASGLPYYDRAATRALYAANPLPPLPPEFRGDALGVHIRFQ